MAHREEEVDFKIYVGRGDPTTLRLAVPRRILQRNPGRAVAEAVRQSNLVDKAVWYPGVHEALDILTIRLKDSTRRKPLIGDIEQLVSAKTGSKVKLKEIKDSPRQPAQAGSA